MICLKSERELETMDSTQFARIKHISNPAININIANAIAMCEPQKLSTIDELRSFLGYEIRAYGHSETAAVYAGISPTKIIMVSMLVSGGLAGLMAINNVMGEAERLVPWRPGPMIAWATGCHRVT